MKITLASKQKHITYYFLLIILMLVGLLSVLFAAGDSRLQMLMLLLITFSYVIIGILHHYAEHDISAKVVIEYVLIGCLGMAIIVFSFR